MEESIDQRDEQRKFNYWDIFRKDVSAQRLTRKSSLSDKIFKGLKLFVYVILFLLVFGGAIVSRGALQILTDQLYLERQTNYTVNLEKDAISYFLLFIISIPDGVKFIVSLMQFLFGKRQSPSCIQLIVVILKECLHFFCLGTIVFKVMPLLNAVEVCAYLSGIPLVPSFLHSISYRKKCLLGGRHVCKQMLNILSIILQAAALFAVPIYKVTNDQISSTDAFLMIFCAFCFSVRWFETYFKYSRESKLFKKLFAYEEREKTHAASSLVTSLFRLVLAIALFPTFFSPGVTNPVETFSSPQLSALHSTAVPTPCLDISKNTTIQLLNTTILPCNLPSSKAFVNDWLLNPFLIHFFTSIGLFYGAIISTRLCMDKVCFCIALTFGTPVYVTGVFIAHIIKEPNWISNTLMSKEVTDTGVYTMLVVFVIAWLSQLWTCRHIWYSSHDRMVFVSRLFVLPHYCSPVADLSLLHSRRHKSKHFEDRYQEDDSVKTKVYICATMWHENRIEMKQILKTLFRLDMDQAARSIAKNDVSLSASTESVFESGLDKKAVMRDYYEFEAHIMFDDAMETTQGKEGEGKKRVPNEFVQQLMEIMSEAAMAVYQVPINLAPPDKLATPYGGRLVWTFPGENKLVVHLKDKEKIRHKKRWSQIMYLYYLIGYKLVNSEIQQMKEKVKEDFESVQSIFERLPANLVQQLLCCLLCVADHDVTGIPYPGDDASVPELVQYYHQLCYTSLQICGFLLFVHGTFMSCFMLKRLKRRLNIRRRNNQSPLPTVVRTILALHRNGLSNVGYRYMWRTLNIGFGLCVTQSRARLCLRTIDQQGVLNRSRRVLRRRVYYNRGPNYLIHVDGYDKLKPYGIAIHGAIDGYSRKLLWLIASPSNNNPRYVGYWYLNWIKQRKMLPRVVRSDAGTENVIMRDLQRSLRHNQNDEMSGQNSFLVGRSVANQRIERLWGTLKTSFTQFWRNRFQDFQDTGLLNVSCPVHKECVRFCFLSVIQHQLDMFAENWNSHRIRRQRAEVVTPSGIPNMLYYQPEIFGGRDCSFPLPCNLQTIDNLIEEYTENFPEHGCSNEFINIVELLTGNRRDQFPIITSYDDAELLFRTLIAALPN